MASIKLIIKTKKEPVEPYVRLFLARDKERKDIFVKSGILIPKVKYWSNRKQNFNAVSDRFPKQKILQQINYLKEFIIIELNEAYTNGELIDKKWLEQIIGKFHKRPLNDGDDTKIYFTPFFEQFVNDSETRINISTGKKINFRTIQKYRTTLLRLKEYEQKKNSRLRHNDIGLDFHRNFVSFLSLDGNYGRSTIEKYISQIKMICREVEATGYPINSEYKSRKFTFRRQKPLDPYLNTSEIQKIFDLNIEDDRLSKIRDLFLIGLWTGLRISDFKQLSRLNIVDDNILIKSTVKTSSPVTIPIHPQVKAVLSKYENSIPKIGVTEKTLVRLFNSEIKKICKLAGIDQVILGDKKNSKTNRNERGFYPKYELVSSHICRRSFCSNHYGKLPNQAIMSITTHSSEKQFLEYVKISNEEYIEKVRAYWAKNEGNKDD